MNEQTGSGRPWGLCPQTPGIYRIVAKGKWHLPGRETLGLHAPAFLLRPGRLDKIILGHQQIVCWAMRGEVSCQARSRPRAAGTRVDIFQDWEQKRCLSRHLHFWTCNRL
jgi:hypothetical protein